MDDIMIIVLDECRKTTGKPLGGATAGDTMESLGLDSLDVAEACMDLETRLGITLADDALTSQNTVAQVVAFVEAALKRVKRKERSS